uniref:beta-defensin 1-like n=1 Tax=Podarcis muralis TaxID=64176 RepID=UPI00109F77B7|nr:beta-defensin 1-like [Podarcis muralis]
MKLLHFLLSALLIMVLPSPGSATAPSSDLECQQQKGLCFPGRCSRPWRSIGTCNVVLHHCCKRKERRNK